MHNIMRYLMSTTWFKNRYNRSMNNTIWLDDLPIILIYRGNYRHMQSAVFKEKVDCFLTRYNILADQKVVRGLSDFFD